MEKARYVTLAMLKDNLPYLVSLSHGYNHDEKCVYFHCADQGKKLDYLRDNPRVWGQALLDYGYDENECSQHYATVMFSGEASFIEDENEKWDILADMTKKLVADPERLIRARNRATVMTTIVGKIKIEHMTGKKSDSVEILGE